LNVISALTELQKIKNGFPPTKASIKEIPTPAPPSPPPTSESKEEVRSESEMDQYEFELSEDESVVDTDIQVLKEDKKISKSKPEKLSCDICGKILSSKGNLKKHQVLHSSVKPWECKECNISFNQARDLNTHKMQKHSEERPHTCKVISHHKLTLYGCP
jgi:hypothetical protein